MLRCSLYLVILGIICAGIVLSQNVVVLKIDGAINPASSAFIERGIESSAEKNAECLIIQLNTPGGLLTSTRIIVSAILESKIPIVVYVAPGGAHAGSAGVFITMAAHIAAMAPGTNIGAAHPVEMEGKMDSVMGEKVTNDAARSPKNETVT
jgi:membrane-bound serine protease (ClpP class)